jgi:hypothetical protein
LGTKRVRLANLPPQLSTRTIHQALGKYGEVRDVVAEIWNNTYRFTVDSGVHIATVTLTTHILSHIYINGYRALVSYDSQPVTCYKCNETGHMYMDCPKKKTVTGPCIGGHSASCADVVAGEMSSLSTTPRAPSDVGLVPATTHFPPLPDPVMPPAIGHCTESESPILEPSIQLPGGGEEMNSENKHLCDDRSPTVVEQVATPPILATQMEEMDIVPTNREQTDTSDVVGVLAVPTHPPLATRAKQDGRSRWSEDDFVATPVQTEEAYSPKRQKKQRIHDSADTPTQRTRSRSRSSSIRS